MSLLLLLLAAASWHLLVRWKERSAGRRATLLKALERAEEDLRRALEGERVGE
jgi:hypothetical protein